MSTSLRLPGRYATVRWQIWQRVTGRRVTVTGKRREPELLISSPSCHPCRGDLAGRHRGDHLSHVGVDQLLAGRGGYRDPVVPVGYEVLITDAIDLDRRDRLTAALRQREPLPPVPHPGGGRPEAPVEVASRAGRANDGVQPDRLQPQLPLATPAQRADGIIQRHQPVGSAAPAQAVRQRGQELAPPGPQEIVLDVCPRESGIWHRTALSPPAGNDR